jgi:hypothetical protein
MNTNKKPTKAESSRINGSKSNGPTSEAGKERSSQNRTTHGIYSSRVVLTTESQDTYNELEAALIRLFQPADAYETICLTDMIVARWRIRRLRATDTANIELAMEDARATLHSTYQNLTPAHELALAYRSMPQANNIANFLRLEDQQQRLYDRSYRSLARHRGKNTALPSLAAIAEAESALPPDNFTRFNPFETNIDTQNQEYEPETPPDRAPLARAASPEPKSSKSKPDDRPRNPNMVYQDEYDMMKPIYDALDEVDPELRLRVADALLQCRAKNKTPKAA